MIRLLLLMLSGYLIWRGILSVFSSRSSRRRPSGRVAETRRRGRTGATRTERFDPATPIEEAKWREIPDEGQERVGEPAGQGKRD